MTRNPAAARPSHRLIALLLLIVLAACGPGTGGTGTGPETGSGVGAPSDAGNAPGDSLVAAGELRGSWRAGDVLAVFESQRIRVQQGCRAYVYEGAWTTDPVRGLDQALRPESVAGAPAAGAAADPVTLQVVPIDAEHLRITVRDAAGGTLIGPLVVQRAPVPSLSATGC